MGQPCHPRVTRITSSSMTVPMMCVRKVRVCMPQRFVPVGVSVSGPRGDRRIMLMLVVRISAVHMFVLVFECFVKMLVLVPLR